MKKIYQSFFFALFLSFFFFSCSKDDPIDGGGASTGGETVNKWIESVMRDNYYWYQDMPKSSGLNFGSTPETFFESLLSSKDGKSKNGKHYYYSSIEQTVSTRATSSSNSNLSLGFEFQYYYVTNEGVYALQVLYILPNSPASRSNLKRGDWIFSINGGSVTPEAIAGLNNGSDMTLGISATAQPSITKSITLRAEVVEDNPVYLTSTFSYGGQKIGYLVYNHFTSGKNGATDEGYNNTLRQAFSQFKNAGVNDFILDLRYNGGGLVSSAQLLATMLAPASALGDVFCNMIYSDKQTNRNKTLTLDTKYMTQGGSGANLNLGRLFVITSSRTASASEAVINGLRPFFGDKLIVVGDRTEGKNVGSITFNNKNMSWVLHPIVCLISNKSGFSDYADGLLPTFFCKEPSSEVSLYNLGDQDEYILRRVLRFIAYNEPIEGLRSGNLANETGLTYISSSLDRRNVGGMLLPQE